ncbi:MAG: carboxy-S-adenosyl-L-methionine synthase CmoA [Gammaproteobacteria bacterium]|nr:carboxy-S-adenosyl-L-methionine synthase CmoA [Gammaproteobacteria bacterium]MCP5406876.1 carboxy-S-adenosyl-L-methionine synthase CmoA [Chromatiaceae bacterium]MCP5408438.1 carboxy-S-adenosyl-L-methionine synthase CmoA [Chromatiaceae bacterium]MCP5444912.1 carboxy-S-adenosyl-L-methionine synthase CmoA [Chromatiaceae bacterium]
MSDIYRDNIYRNPDQPTTEFVFDRQVARVFSDMIHRSVPGYSTVINMIGVLAGEYVQSGSVCYDLGCSLGASSLALAQGITAKECRIVAVDNSPEMLEQAGRQTSQLALSTPIEWLCADVLDVQIGNASMVVLNFTLQFIPPHARLQLLTNIRKGLRPQGLLVLSEKITFQDPGQDRLQIEMHHAFKRANGYNDLEISRKRSALEKVLIPETLETHRTRLAEAGFGRTDLWFQCFNFVSLVARP